MSCHPNLDSTGTFEVSTHVPCRLHLDSTGTSGLRVQGDGPDIRRTNKKFRFSFPLLLGKGKSVNVISFYVWTRELNVRFYPKVHFCFNLPSQVIRDTSVKSCTRLK